jgi:hypothetical protein
MFTNTIKFIFALSFFSASALADDKCTPWPPDGNVYIISKAVHYDIQIPSPCYSVIIGGVERDPATLSMNARGDALIFDDAKAAAKAKADADAVAAAQKAKSDCEQVKTRLKEHKDTGEDLRAIILCLLK